MNKINLISYGINKVLILPACCRELGLFGCFKLISIQSKDQAACFMNRKLNIYPCFGELISAFAAFA